ncbi:MAG TPA: tetratricopeptide repeat protein [Puia sp.]|nr:tetratricopeptide repeat protein [Puia sp.]
MTKYFSTYHRIKTILLFSLFSCLSTFIFAQQKEEADNLVQEGVDFQDKGVVDSAFSRYNMALKMDRDNLAALAEMAYSYLSVEKYDEAISYSKRALKTHPHDPVLKTVYVSYGNALDGEGKTEKAVDIYNEGIHFFPDYFQLYYNKGISQIKLNQAGDALLSFERSATLNPKHASSHNAIGRLLFMTNKIPSLMAFCRFLVLEPNSKRSSANLNNVQQIMGAHVDKKGANNVTVNVSPELLDTNKKKEKNNFSGAELVLAVNSSLDFDSTNVNKTDVEKFIRKISMLCKYLQEIEKDNYGFYWDYYVPYFTVMNDKGLTEVFAYIAFACSEDPTVKVWLESHKAEVAGFYKWSDGFLWRIN